MRFTLEIQMDLEFNEDVVGEDIDIKEELLKGNINVLGVKMAIVDPEDGVRFDVEENSEELANKIVESMIGGA